MTAFGRRTFVPAMALVVGMAIGFGGIAPSEAKAGCKGAQKQTQNIAKKRARAAVQCLFNKERRGQNVKSNGQLKRAAQSHSAYMRKRNCLSHQCPGEASLGQRVARTGYLRGASSWAYGEVIARYSPRVSPATVVRQWMSSSSHRPIILDRRYEHVGVGLSTKNGRSFYTAVLGARSG